MSGSVARSPDWQEPCARRPLQRGMLEIVQQGSFALRDSAKEPSSASRKSVLRMRDFPTLGLKQLAEPRSIKLLIHTV